jgi:ribonucleotide reductase beta subunit family protein with ferritin-like domain
MAIIEVLARQYALENIRFFVSFLYTFKINEMNEQVLQGSVNNIKLILNDEIIHTVIFRNLINILKDSKDEGFHHLFEDDFLFDASSMFVRCFDEVIKSEMEWFRYLSSIQDISGFNDETVLGFLQYYTHTALKYIGVEYLKEDVQQNELVLFFESKKNLNSTKALAQETNLLTYNIGVLEDGGCSAGDLDIDAEKLLREGLDG